jgi:uncharacterized protein YyaL (SSP411 family)
MTPTIKTLLLLSCFAAATPGALAADSLAGEPSAFLKTIANSPVNWMPWGGAAIARAKTEQKPVFLFVGSFTSELSASMRRQSFANRKTADWLNKNFVCVVVDRDERPDVAALYQAYVGTIKQMTGWPLNIWLTPEFQPYEGATYLSPSEDWGAPGFLKLANQALSAWTTNPASCRKRAADSTAQMAPTPPPKPGPWSPEKLQARLSADAVAWRATFDPAQGGFGDLPRSPEPELLRFMLLEAPEDREPALKTLRVIATSAIRDPLDGGFFRHASDAAWRIPYPQKTVSDQARIALAFMAAAEGPDAASFTECARGALDYALSRLTHSDGTLAASEDATGDEFARYYAWTEAEIDAVLGPGSAAFKAAHGVVAGGNVPAADDPSSIFAQRNLLCSTALADSAQGSAASLLLAARDRRGTPPRDERATAAQYGLFINALARAGIQMHEPRYLDAARRLLDVVRKNLMVSQDGTLRRLVGSGVPAYADDYAALALACRGLMLAANDKAAGDLSSRFLAQLDARFYDASSGAYFGAPSPAGPGFFMRPASAGDPPTVETVAILARSSNSGAIAAALLQSLDESSPQAPGDQLLALALFGKRRP